MKHVFFLTEFSTHGFYKRNMRRTKRLKTSRHCRLGMGGMGAPLTVSSPHSHSALLTHSPATDGSDWSAKWNKHGFGARRAPIGCSRRPSIQTGLLRSAGNHGELRSGSGARSQCRVSLHCFICFLSHFADEETRLFFYRHDL